MKCKKCGATLSANTLDHCPKCNPKPAQPEFAKTGRALNLVYFIVINILILLGLVYLIQLVLKAWIPSLPFMDFDPPPSEQ